METASQPPVATSGEDKTAAILAYLTIIGFIAAAVINSSKKTKLGAFHLRQVLGMIVTGVGMIVLLFIPILGWIAYAVLGILLLVCWIMGLIAAIGGEMKPAPIVGPYYQKWFGTTFE